MCGIIGYIGTRNAIPVLLEGLKRLEYRGYDSAGVAFMPENRELIIIKQEGRIEKLKQKIIPLNYNAHIGIAHTRWATHGIPSERNAHPHTDCKNRIAVVHNGIIENYRILREVLEKQGHTFKSDTDTEVLAHLIEEFYKETQDLLLATREALLKVEGTYGISVISLDEPDRIIVARNGSPLVVGKGDGEALIASDVAPIIPFTDQVVYLNDREIAVVKKDWLDLTTIDETGIKITPRFEQITWNISQIERGGYPHFMLKEIFEQPVVLQDTMRGRLIEETGNARLGGLSRAIEDLHRVKRIIVVACGTSWHAGLIGEYLIENLARTPVEVEYASEFRYRNPVIPDPKHTIVFAVSQSGETADTLAAMREAKQRGALTLGICNVVGSTIARETDGGVYIHAGPEIGVASTKAFTAQVTVFTMIALLLGRMRGLSAEDGKKIVAGLKQIPHQMQKILNQAETIKELAERFKSAHNFLYLGRSYNFPVALEGALKMKEISYIHAEGYPAAEMKHGPIALIDERMPVVVIALKDSLYDKVISNIEEIKARKGIVIAIATEGDEDIKDKADYVLYIPKTLECLTPLLSVIPLQLLAYYTATAKGLDAVSYTHLTLPTKA